MILTADIGASKVKIATFDYKNYALKIKHVERYLTKDYSTFSALLQAFLAAHPSLQITAAAIGGAGIVAQNKITLTNLNWQITVAQVAADLNTNDVYLLNDVEAHGYGIAGIQSSELMTLQAGQPRPGNMAFIAVGSGLGESILAWNGKDHIPFSTEGGHTDFGPATPQEEALLAFLRLRYDSHVSWERVVSGKFGFRNLYDFLLNTGEIKITDPLLTKIQDRQEIGEILQKEANAGSTTALGILQWFSALLGAESGNLALKAIPTAGIYIGGGIVRRHAELLKNSDNFIAAFCNKGRMSHLLKDIPVHIVMDQNLAVRGLANYVVKQKY
jgi:glucokinase